MFEGKNKRRNKSLAYLTSIALIFALFNNMMTSIGAEALGQDEEQVKEQVESPEVFVAYFAEELQGALDDYIEIIELADDIELEETLVIPDGADIAVNGNGHYIRSPFIDAPAIEVSSGGALTLSGVTVEGQSALVADLGSGGITVGFGGFLTMGEGSFVRGFAGGGVVVNGGSLVLDGGTIAYNGDAGSFGLGGGIRLSGGELIMHSGEVRNNTARTAGGVFVAGPAHIALYGGEIHSNHAEAGGGLFLEPPNPYFSHDQTIALEIGKGAENMIFDNDCGTDIRWVEGGPGIQGIVINDLSDFIESYDPVDEDSDRNLILLLPGENTEEESEEEESAEEEVSEGVSEEGKLQDEPGVEPDNEFDDGPGDEPEAGFGDGGPENGLPEEDMPTDEPGNEPQGGLADLKATNPQTGDEFSFFGLVTSAVGFTLSAFVVFVHREKEKSERAYKK